MIVIFENFQVQEFDLSTKEIVRNYNLQEIEGFEISDAVEEDKVIDFVLEKDMQLLAVASMDKVHIFEYSEDSISYVNKIEEGNVKRVIFSEYSLVMAQEESTQINLLCFDLESEQVSGSLKIDKPDNQLILQTGSSCFYFVTGPKFGKIELPEMKEAFLIDTGVEIIDMTIGLQS
jgi:hypothetical protein